MSPPQPSPAGPHSIPCSAHVSGLQFKFVPASGGGPESPVWKPGFPGPPGPASMPCVSGLNVDESSDPHATIKATAVVMNAAARTKVVERMFPEDPNATFP